MWTVFWISLTPPSCTILTKQGLCFWTSGKPPSTSPTISTRFMGDRENKETTCDHRVKVYAFQNALPLRSNDDKKAKMTQKKVGFELEDLCATVFRRLTITRALFFLYVLYLFFHFNFYHLLLTYMMNAALYLLYSC